MDAHSGSRPITPAPTPIAPPAYILEEMEEGTHLRSDAPAPTPITPPAHIIEEAHHSDTEEDTATPLLPQAGKTRNDPIDNSNHVVDLKQEKDEDLGDVKPENRQTSERSCIKKRSVIFTNIGIFVAINTITGLLMYFFGRTKTIGGVTVFNWALMVDVLVCGLILVMVVVKTISFLLGKISRRIRYYTAPFVTATYTAVWAFVSLVLMAVFLTDEEYHSRVAVIIKNFLNIVASCSLVSVGGNILILVMERVVFGDMQGNLNESLRNERLVALVAMRDHANRRIWKVLQANEPYNVLSLANLVRSGNYGLSYWLKIETSPNEKLTVFKTAVTTSELIMSRASDPNFLKMTDLANTPHMKPKDAYKVFKLLDYNDRGKITKDEIRAAVANIIHERKAVVDLLKSRRLIVDILAQIIYGIVFIICAVITLVVFIGVDVYTLLVALGTTFIGLGFALSTSLTGVLESLQMLFFVRPFEIGDIVRINDGSAMQVERVTIISTFFYSMDGYGVHFPNAELARAKISNYRRSKDVSLDIPVYLKLGTTAEQLALVQEEVREYLKERPQFNPRFFFGVLETHPSYVLAMLMVSLKSTWQEKLIWNKFAADLRIFITSRLVQLGIYYEYLENVANSYKLNNNQNRNNTTNTNNNTVNLLGDINEDHHTNTHNAYKPSMSRANNNVNHQGSFLTKRQVPHENAFGLGPNYHQNHQQNLQQQQNQQQQPQHRRMSLTNIFNNIFDGSNHPHHREQYI